MRSLVMFTVFLIVENSPKKGQNQQLIEKNKETDI